MKLFIRLLVVFCFALSTNVYSQEVISDKLLEDGTRYIVTSNKYTGGFSDRIPLSYFLAVYSSKSGEVTWDIGLEVQAMFPVVIRPNATFLLKTRKGETITLNTIIGASDQIGKYNSSIRMSLYRAYPSFKISKDNLDKLINDGVQKVRLEIEGIDLGYVDKVYNKEKVAPILLTERDLLVKRLNSPIKTIEDDF